MNYNIINDAKDDLNIVLHDIIHNKRPKRQSLDQIEHVKPLLEKELNNEEIDNYDAAEIVETINLIEDVLKIYATEKDKMSSIKIRETTKIRLNKIAPTYDAAITRLLDKYES